MERKNSFGRHGKLDQNSNMSDNITNYNEFLEPKTQFVEWLIDRLVEDEKEFTDVNDISEEYKLLCLKNVYLMGMVKTLEFRVQHSPRLECKDIYEKLLEKVKEDNKKLMIRANEIYDEYQKNKKQDPN